jgi:hypothetical protein
LSDRLYDQLFNQRFNRVWPVQPGVRC